MKSRLIKKYPNRKLYDVSTSRYTTLKEIADLVIENVDLEIIENETKLDITADTLRLVAANYLPVAVPLLRSLIQAGRYYEIGR